MVEIPDVFLPAEEYLDMFDSESDSSSDLGHIIITFHDMP